MLTYTSDFPVRAGPRARRCLTPRDGTLTDRPFAVTLPHPAAGGAWSDGVPVTSADAVFTWRTMLDPANRVASRTPWDRVATIRVGGPRRFTVVFKAPYAAWRDLFSPSGGNVLLPRHALSGRDFNTVWNRGGVIGTGPSSSPRTRQASGSGAHAEPALLEAVGIRWRAPSSPGSSTSTSTAAPPNASSSRGGEVNFVAPPELHAHPRLSGRCRARGSRSAAGRDLGAPRVQRAGSGAARRQGAPCDRECGGPPGADLGLDAGPGPAAGQLPGAAAASLLSGPRGRDVGPDPAAGSTATCEPRGTSGTAPASTRRTAVS